MSIFFIATFVVSWVLWLPMLAWQKRRGRLETGDEPLAGLPVIVGFTWLLGSWSPTLVALTLTAREGGGDAVGQLLRRVVDWDVGLGWNLVAVLGPLALGLAGVAWYLVRRGTGVRVAPRRFPLLLVSLVAALPFGPLGEELGWRGFALPDLLESQTGLTSALVIGVIWGAWHIPLFWAPLGTSVSGSKVTPAAIGVFIAEVVAASVIMTWLYIETSGSLWIAIWFHAAWNADMHRFVFEPFDDDAAERVGKLIVAVFVMAAIALIVWPGLQWRV